MSEKLSMNVDTLQAELGNRHVEVVFNEITHRIEIYDHDGILNDSETPFDSLIAYICDQYREDYKYCSKDNIAQGLLLISGRYRVNPILDMILKVDIDTGHNYASRICDDYIRIPQDDSLSRTLIEKYFMQVVAMLLNDSINPYGADGILVFIGMQGIGKSLGAECFSIDSRYYRSISFNAYTDEADLLAKANGCFIGEFSELERSLKPSTMEMFKAFITAGKDSYRPKYGRSVCDYIRRSSYIATCNTDNFLYDQTGNRRFWTIPCGNKFDIDRLIDCKNGNDDIFLKAYKEAYLKLQSQGVQSFRLTSEELELLDTRNNRYMHRADLDGTLMEILRSYTLREFTVSQLKDNYPDLRSYDNAVIGKALSRIQVGQRIRKIARGNHQSTERYYQNPYAGL